MTNSRPWLTLAVLTLAADTFLLGTSAAHACSCLSVDEALWSPSDREPAPLNARVTLARSDYNGGKLVVRPVGGTAVATSEQVFEAGSRDIVVLTPDQLLAPHTRYEVAMIERTSHPRTLVFGTFKTGDHRDDKPPGLEPLHQATFYDRVVMKGSSCASHERWLSIQLTPARDESPGEVLYGLWLGDAQGKLDLTRPPVAIARLRRGPDVLIFGATSMCSPVRVRLPRWVGKRTLAVAAFDRAGNRSTVQQSVVLAPKQATP